LYVRLRNPYRIMRSASRTEAVAVFAESEVQNRLQYLQQRLLECQDFCV